MSRRCPVTCTRLLRDVPELPLLQAHDELVGEDARDRQALCVLEQLTEVVDLEVRVLLVENRDDLDRSVSRRRVDQAELQDRNRCIHQRAVDQFDGLRDGHADVAKRHLVGVHSLHDVVGVGADLGGLDEILVRVEPELMCVPDAKFVGDQRRQRAITLEEIFEAEREGVHDAFRSVRM